MKISVSAPDSLYTYPERALYFYRMPIRIEASNIKNYAKNNRVKHLYLGCNSQNFGAIKLYKKCGFKKVFSEGDWKEEDNCLVDMIYTLLNGCLGLALWSGRKAGVQHPGGPVSNHSSSKLFIRLCLFCKASLSLLYKRLF